VSAGTIVRYLRIPLSRKCILLETLLLMAVTRVLTWFLPLRMLAPFYGRMDRSNPPPERSGVPEREIADLSPRQKELMWQVRWALRMAKLHLPCEGTCLPRALAGSVMLRRRGLPATVRIGAFRREGEELKLHAWLTTFGEVPISGVREADGFTVLATYTA
jgi:hypothetical protein